MKTAHIKASASVTLETPIVECTDHLKARTFELTEGGTMKGNVTHSGGSLSSNGVTVHSHVHGGVQGGSSNTGGRNDSPLYRHEPGRHGPAYRYRSAVEFSTRHTDHAAGKPGDATDYGSMIPDLLDEPQNEVTRLQCMSAAVIALTMWEPRIALNGINISYSKDGAVTAELVGIITETMQTVQR
jgi:hypothetical protein